MISEQRVILMSRLAMHEKKEGEENKAIGTYFRSDYISLRLVGSVIAAALSFALIFVLYVLYDSEEFIDSIYQSDVAGVIQKILFYFVIFVISYCVITYIFYAVRYRKARNRLKVYFNNLRRLQILYQRERKERK